MPLAQEFQRYQAKEVLEWEDAQMNEMMAHVETIRPLLSRFAWLPLPPVVSLFRTTGKEETGVNTVPVAYCRGSSNIFISDANFTVDIAREGLLKLLLHELVRIYASALPLSVVLPHAGFVSGILCPAMFKQSFSIACTHCSILRGLKAGLCNIQKKWVRYKSFFCSSL